MRTRELRAQRQAKEQLRFLPDTEEVLSQLTEDAEELGLYEEESFPLIEGASVNPRQPWQLPQQKEAK